MARPQIVVFDLGKVLLDFDYAIAAGRIAAQSKLLAKDVLGVIGQTALLFRYETGLLTKAQFFAEVCDATGFCGSLEEFSECFGDIFVPIEPMVELHAELQRSGIPTYIFSNTNELATEHIRKRFPFFNTFNGYILSYQHGAMKPDARLYEVVERETGRRQAEILYLDDRPENVAAGAARGWQVILQETPERTRMTVESLGLLNHR
jgi:FMN phosphatase YigB (HAD superfamily)